MILIMLYAHFFQNFPAQDEEKSPLGGETACFPLSNSGEDGWHLTVTGQRRKRVRAQRPSVAIWGHQLNKEGWNTRTTLETPAGLNFHPSNRAEQGPRQHLPVSSKSSRSLNMCKTSQQRDSSRVVLLRSTAYHDLKIHVYVHHIALSFTLPAHRRDRWTLLAASALWAAHMNCTTQILGNAKRLCGINPVTATVIPGFSSIIYNQGGMWAALSMHA